MRLPLKTRITNRLFYHFNLADGSGTDFFADCRNELSYRLYTFITGKAAAYGNRAVFLFLLSKNKHIRDAVVARVTYLVADFLRTVVNVYKNTVLLQFCRNLIRVVAIFF